MSEPRWTPGPWRHFDNGTCWQVEDGKDAIVTTQFCYARETEANARLIAAAPDFAKAAVAALEWFEAAWTGAIEPEWVKLARTALARARGEP